VLAHQDVIERLLDEDSSALGDFELVPAVTVRLQTRKLCTRRRSTTSSLMYYGAAYVGKILLSAAQEFLGFFYC